MSEVEGMDELQKRLDALGDTKKMLGQLGLMAVAKAKQLVPRKTGNLGRTIRLGSVTDTSNFARRVNHPGTKAKPYLRPAAEEVVRENGIDLIVRAWNDAA
jgi:hypothetical protein